MKYRRFGKSNWETSVLGISATHLPLVNEAESIEMIRYAVDRGVNYLDLGYAYDIKLCEKVCRTVGKALQDGYRRRVKVAAAFPSYIINSANDFNRLLDKQLQWLNTYNLDFYIIGKLNRENWPRLLRALVPWMEEAVNNGRIDKLGFLFHDHFQELKKFLNAYDKWSFCQFQFSFMDVDHDPGINGIKYAAEKGLGVVVSEPLSWGRLAKKPAESIAREWAAAPEKRSLTDWGLRSVWTHPEISCVHADCTTMEELMDYLALADKAGPDTLTVKEQVLISRVRDAFCKLRAIPCTSCRACMPCPAGIDVPRIFEIYNDAHMYNDIKTARFIYLEERHMADKCTGCGDCAKNCAKGIDVLQWLKQVSKVLADNK